VIDRRAILELNRDQREGRNGLAPGGNPEAFGKGTQTWGRHMLRVPVADWRVLCALNPALESKNAAEFSAAWLAFERSDASLPYRVIEDAIHGPRNPVFFGTGRNDST
jgi:hypothetical protein